MPKNNRYRPFVPNPEQMALMPEVSGNSINGLNENDFRRPSYVYWGDNPDDIVHGNLQKWFYTVDPQESGYEEQRKYRQVALDLPLEKLNSVISDFSEKEWLENFEIFKKQEIFDQIGATQFSLDWAFEGIEITFKNIVILGFQHDYDNIKTAPRSSAGLEVMRQYSRAAHGAKFIANWLRKSGWDAEPLTGPMSGKITMIPAALKAGFGELGKHGSIINPEFGSSFRLSAVLTDAPIPLFREREYQIDDFCSKCRICEDACPPEAIFKEKKTVRGEKKWYVDFDKCIPFFNEHQGCSICIAVCPWSKPGIGPNLALKLQQRALRLKKTKDNV